MSCHTWTYKKFSVCDKKQKKEFLDKCNKVISDFFSISFEDYIEKHNKICDIYIDDCKKRNDEEEAKAWEIYKKEGTNLYNKEKQSYEPFKNGVTEDNLLQFLLSVDYNDADIEILDNIVYLEIDFDNPFRCYDYEAPNFTDKEKLLAFLSKTKTIIGFYNNKGEFKEGYSKVLENRINKYFQKHGEDNLLFIFI